MIIYESFLEKKNTCQKIIGWGLSPHPPLPTALHVLNICKKASRRLSVLSSCGVVLFSYQNLKSCSSDLWLVGGR